MNQHRTRTVERDEQGSIAIMVMVSLVVSGLVFATLLTVEGGLRSSRRAGDSANALQVADAGVNDAIKAIPTVNQTQFSRSGTLGNGSYSYTATQDAAESSVWHVDVLGTDKTGVKRRVRADATGQSLFSSPLYVNTGLSASAGAILDSFRSGHSLAGPSGNYQDGGCTDRGVMFFGPGATASFTSGGGGTSVVNCQQLRYSSWKFSMDYCLVYSGGTQLPPTGPSRCPDPNDPDFPGRTKFVTDTFTPPEVRGPTDSSQVQSPTQSPCSSPPCAPKVGTTFVCNSSSGANSLRAGWTYYYSQIDLKNGCGIDPSTIDVNADPAWVAANPVMIYATTVTMDTGTKGRINTPPTASFPFLCGSSVTSWTYKDVNNNPSSHYCSGWSRSLSVNLLTTAASTLSIKGNGGSFWGTFTAPTTSVTLNSPQMEFWGAMLAGSLSVKSQFSWHYDDSLSSQVTGKYSVTNWREEPL
ncbi:MAG TPA: hypothetical protein VK988_08090 [Acidimicrobiales bacterium]|nr:hypothetical protein [Acidimicrobiales bacterium]